MPLTYFSSDDPLDPVLVSRARRAAARCGLVVKKSRRRRSLDNYGGLALIDPNGNWVVAGSRCELTPEEVIKLCSER